MAIAWIVLMRAITTAAAIMVRAIRFVFWAAVSWATIMAVSRVSMETSRRTAGDRPACDRARDQQAAASEPITSRTTAFPP